VPALTPNEIAEKHKIFLQNQVFTVIALGNYPMAQSSVTGSNQTKKSNKVLRLGICAILAFLMLVVGYLFWPKLGRRDPEADSIVRIVPVPPTAPGVAAQSTSDPGNSQSSSRLVTVDPQGTAHAIQARGQAIYDENRKIRDNLAAGDHSALPDSLKVADLPSDTPPPNPVPTSIGR